MTNGSISIMSKYSETHHSQACGKCGENKFEDSYFEEGVNGTICYKATCINCGTLNVLAKREV